MTPSHSLVLAIHPASLSVGWCAFEGPFAPYDWGLCMTGSGDEDRKNERCLARMRKLIRRLRPEVLVLEDFDGPKAMRSSRIKALYAALVEEARSSAVEIVIYARRDIEECFAQAGGRTRDDIAEAVARLLPQLRPRLPARRRPWKGEDKRLALFSACAVALTHYTVGALQLFSDLKRGP